MTHISMWTSDRLDRSRQYHNFIQYLQRQHEPALVTLDFVIEILRRDWHCQLLKEMGLFIFEDDADATVFLLKFS